MAESTGKKSPNIVVQCTWPNDDVTLNIHTTIEEHQSELFFSLGLDARTAISVGQRLVKEGLEALRIDAQFIHDMAKEEEKRLENMGITYVTEEEPPWDDVEAKKLPHDERG